MTQIANLAVVENSCDSDNKPKPTYQSIYKRHQYIENSACSIFFITNKEGESYQVSRTTDDKTD